MSLSLEHFTASDGEAVSVKVIGEGRPLVFLRGWTANHRDWLCFQTALAQQCRSYAWDARGYGGYSLHTVTVPSLERMAAAACRPPACLFAEPPPGTANRLLAESGRRGFPRSALPYYRAHLIDLRRGESFFQLRNGKH